MVNTTTDFADLVKDSLRETLGGSKKVSVHPLMHDRMNDQLQTFKSKNGKNGMNMKIKFECARCSRTWSSSYGNTQWYYKLDVHRDSAGQVLGCSLYFKVHTYTQKCERCDGNGKIEPYDDEYERLAKTLCNALAGRLDRTPIYKLGTQRPSPNMRRGHQKSRCGACKAGVCNSRARGR